MSRFVLAVGRVKSIRYDLDDPWHRLIGAGDTGQVLALGDGAQCIKIMNPQECGSELDHVLWILENQIGLYATLRDVASVPMWPVYDMPAHVSSVTDVSEYRKYAGRMLGYGMARYPEGWWKLSELKNPQSAGKLGVGFKETALIFMALHEALTKIHSQGFIVGDLNSNNVLFKEVAGWYQVMVIDVDTWSIRRDDLGHVYHSNLIHLTDVPHPAYHRAFKAGQPPPQPKTDFDWWTFAFHLYKSLTYHHPFSGVHKDNRTTRIINGITAVHPDTDLAPEDRLATQRLGKDLLTALDDHLSVRKSGPFPLKPLVDFYKGAS